METHSDCRLRESNLCRSKWRCKTFRDLFLSNPVPQFPVLPVRFRWPSYKLTPVHRINMSLRSWDFSFLLLLILQNHRNHVRWTIQSEKDWISSLHWTSPTSQRVMDPSLHESIRTERRVTRRMTWQWYRYDGRNQPPFQYFGKFKRKRLISWVGKCFNIRLQRKIPFTIFMYLFDEVRTFIRNIWT